MASAGEPASASAAASQASTSGYPARRPSSSATWPSPTPAKAAPGWGKAQVTRTSRWHCSRRPDGSAPALHQDAAGAADDAGPAHRAQVRPGQRRRPDRPGPPRASAAPWWAGRRPGPGSHRSARRCKELWHARGAAARPPAPGRPPPPGPGTEGSCAASARPARTGRRIRGEPLDHRRMQQHPRHRLQTQRHRERRQPGRHPTTARSPAPASVVPPPSPPPGQNPPPGQAPRPASCCPAPSPSARCAAATPAAAATPTHPSCTAPTTSGPAKSPARPSPGSCPTTSSLTTATGSTTSTASAS